MVRLRITGKILPIASLLMLPILPLAATAAVVSLPSNSTIVGINGTTSIPLSIDIANGVLGGDFTVQYDPSVVIATAVDPGDLTGTCSVGSNPTIGEVAMSVACTMPLSGSGSLFSLTFQALKVSSTTLTITQCTLNEGGIPCTPTNGNLSVVLPTATASPTRTPIPTATPTGPPAVNLGTAAGRPGGTVCLPASLSYGTPAVSATGNDIGYSASVFTLSSCVINPAIGAGTTANKQLNRSTLGSGADRITVTGANNNLIPPTVLYSCTFAIGAGAAAGSYAVSNTASASDASGNNIPSVTGAAGLLRVTSCAGDCDGNGAVSIGEVVKCVNLFLGQPLCNTASPSASCPVADTNLNGSISIGEVIQCVNRFLSGC